MYRHRTNRGTAGAAATISSSSCSRRASWRRREWRFRPIGGRGQWVQLRGTAPRSNVLTIDGLDNNDEYSGSSRTELSLETVKEFEVVTNGWSVESGGGWADDQCGHEEGRTSFTATCFLRTIGPAGCAAIRKQRRRATFVESVICAGRGVRGPMVTDRAPLRRRGAGTCARSGIDLGGVERHQSSSLTDAPLGGTQGSTDGLSFDRPQRNGFSPLKVNHQPPRNSRSSSGWPRRETASADAFNTGGLRRPGESRNGRDERDLAGTGSWLTIIVATTPRTRCAASWRVGASTSVRMEQDGAGFVIPGVIEFGRAYRGNSHPSTTDVRRALGDTGGLALGNHPAGR